MIFESGPTLTLPISLPNPTIHPKSLYHLARHRTHRRPLRTPTTAATTRDDEQGRHRQGRRHCACVLASPVSSLHLSSSSSALLSRSPSSPPIHRCPFRPHPAAEQCDARADNIKDIVTHYLRKHVIPGKTKADALILQQLPPLANHTCTVCKRIYIGIKKHTRSAKCDPSMTRSSASRHTKEG